MGPEGCASTLQPIKYLDYDGMIPCVQVIFWSKSRNDFLVTGAVMYTLSTSLAFSSSQLSAAVMRVICMVSGDTTLA